MEMSLQNYFYFFRVNHFSRIITNDSAYIKYEISTLVWSLLDYRLQFMCYAMKALRCNGFVDGPVSLQLTGHPFAKPHVPCVVSNSKLNFVSVLLPQTSKQWLPLLHLMILPVLPLESESYSLQALLPHLTDRLPRFQS